MTAPASKALLITPRLLLAVFVGGALGTLARYGVTQHLLVGHHLVGTLVVNLGGSALLGAAIAWSRLSDRSTSTVTIARLGLGVGFCGGLTTYSSFAVDSVRLVEGQLFVQAALYILGTLLLAALSVVVGMRAVEQWVSKP